MDLRDFSRSDYEKIMFTIQGIYLQVKYPENGSIENIISKSPINSNDPVNLEQLKEICQNESNKRGIIYGYDHSLRKDMLELCLEGLKMVEYDKERT